MTTHESSEPATATLGLMHHIKPLRFVIVFTLIFLALQWGYYAIPDQFLTDVVIQRGIVQVSAEILGRLFGITPIEAIGADLVSPTARLSVVRGCDGTAVLIVLVSAMLALGGNTLRLVISLVIATGFVYALNQVRIVWMFLLLQSDPALFHLAHIYVAPAAMVSFSVIGFVWWASLQSRLQSA
jgi:exosortase family protein XrtM